MCRLILGGHLLHPRHTCLLCVYPRLSFVSGIERLWVAMFPVMNYLPAVVNGQEAGLGLNVILPLGMSSNAGWLVRVVSFQVCFFYIVCVVVAIIILFFRVCIHVRFYRVLLTGKQFMGQRCWPCQLCHQFLYIFCKWLFIDEVTTPGIVRKCLTREGDIFVNVAVSILRTLLLLFFFNFINMWPFN